MPSGVAAEIKSKLPVIEVIGETVLLKRAGSAYKGLCPFHGEKTPSFVVTPDRETWHCFGCGQGGDIFTFLMQRDGSTSERRSRGSPNGPGLSSRSERLRRIGTGDACAKPSRPRSGGIARCWSRLARPRWPGPTWPSAG